MQTVIPKSTYAYGIYETGSKQYLNKTDALIEASRTGADVHWNFHDAVYQAHDWTKRPLGTLKDLYKQRAQQIRDKYDYVVVHFSGGADSWTVLNSFLSNGLHVDEVFSRWATTAEQKYKTANFTDKRESNLFSEYEFAAYPVLKEIEKKYPHTYIHIDDYSSEYEHEVGDHNLRHGGHYLTLGTFYRFSRKSPAEQRAAEAGKKIAVVYGFDKIQYCTKDNNMYAYFVDRFGGTDQDPARNVEAFYWSPELPEIPIMQAHDMKMYYEQNPLLMGELDNFNRKSYIRVCYPDYNIGTFQVGKAIGAEIWQSELWIRQHNPRYVESWRWAVNQYINNVDARFCDFLNNKFRLGYKVSTSNMYSLGPVRPF